MMMMMVMKKMKTTTTTLVFNLKSEKNIKKEEEKEREVQKMMRWTRTILNCFWRILEPNLFDWMEVISSNVLSEDKQKMTCPKAMQLVAKTAKLKVRVIFNVDYKIFSQRMKIVEMTWRATMILPTTEDYLLDLVRSLMTLLSWKTTPMMMQKQGLKDKLKDRSQSKRKRNLTCRNLPMSIGGVFKSCLKFLETEKSMHGHWKHK
ncbi:predicted protein, partial [Lodderomyces elongisporus NRRL YB-4239]